MWHQVVLLHLEASTDLVAEQQFHLQNSICTETVATLVFRNVLFLQIVFEVLIVGACLPPALSSGFGVLCVSTHTQVYCSDVMVTQQQLVSEPLGTLRIVLSCQNKRQLYFVHVQSCVGYPTAAVTRKTPTPALGCPRIGLCHTAPAFSRILQHLPPRLYDDSTTSSCLPFLPHPLPCQPIREKLGRDRAGSTASGRRSGPRAANGKPYCPGRAQVPAQTKGPEWRRK